MKDTLFVYVCTAELHPFMQRYLGPTLYDFPLILILYFFSNATNLISHDT